MRQAVQARYGTIAETRGAMTCCESALVTTLDEKAHQVGYSTEDTQAVPEGANLGLGCGNPVAIASLSSCVTGAALLDEVEQMLQAAGFTAIRIQPKDESKTFAL